MLGHVHPSIHDTCGKQTACHAALFAPACVIFHLPLSLAHWSTGCWPLSFLAKRSRFRLLVSLAQSGLPLLSLGDGTRREGLDDADAG